MSFFDSTQNEIDPYEEQRIYEAEKLEKEDNFSSRFEKRFGEKVPWLIRKRSTRQGAYRFSFVCNLVSVFAGFYGASVILEIFPVPYLNYILAVGILIIMEIFKRKFSDEFWDQYFATKTFKLDAAFKNFALFSISIALSGFGMYFAVNDLSPEAKQLGLKDDPQAAALLERVDKLDKDLIDIRADQSNYDQAGTFYHIHAKKENNWIAERDRISKKLEEDYNIIIQDKNSEIKKEWKLRTAFRSYAGVISTLLSEFIFEICMCFCSYYDYRYYRAMVLARKAKARKEDLNGTRKKSPAPVVRY